MVLPKLMGRMAPKDTPKSSSQSERVGLGSSETGGGGEIDGSQMPDVPSDTQVQPF